MIEMSLILEALLRFSIAFFFYCMIILKMSVILTSLFGLYL